MALPDGLAALFNLRPDRAADFLLEKDLQLTGPYWELDGPAHSRVFTVANLAKLDVLADIKDAVQEAIDTGQTERWFRQQLEGVLRKKGWWGPLVQVDPDTLEARIIQAGSRRRLQTIYRTNLQSAYMAGRNAQALEQIDRAPWAQYLAVRDSRSRPAHAALHGKVFRLDSPEWSIISPPNGYNCRCRARYLSDRELERRKLKPETDVRILERTPERVPTDPLTGETPARIIERGVSVPSTLKPGERDVLWADRGWDHLPGSDGAERALVDRVMASADKVGDIREVVLADLRRNGVEVALPLLPMKKIPSSALDSSANGANITVKRGGTPQAPTAGENPMTTETETFRPYITSTKGGKPALVATPGAYKVGDVVEAPLDPTKGSSGEIRKIKITGMGKPFRHTTPGGVIDEEDARSFGGTGQRMTAPDRQSDRVYYYGDEIRDAAVRSGDKKRFRSSKGKVMDAVVQSVSEDGTAQIFIPATNFRRKIDVSELF